MSNSKRSTPTGIAAEIINRDASSWLTEQYLPFAMYAIKDRALVDDDGLKPVNRRIVYSMFKKGITSNAEYLKAARCAADAVAYHPHGSQSVEDALARMAQGFSLRVPLIDPHGSVGKVAGDMPAAARYWEARLSKAAMELVKEIPLGGVELGKNFDGKLDEPKILPVRWPVSIINGSQGIAVGYASNMPAHNPDEVMEAARKLLKNPNMTLKQLMKIMPGPDMPSGGELVGTEAVEQYYETGKGTFIIRGRYNIEQLARGKTRITFFELPYQIAAREIIKKIRESQARGVLKEIVLLQDQTDKTNGLRLVIETKAGTNYKSVLNELFKGKYGLQSKFSVNNTLLVSGTPKVMSIKDQLLGFIELRKAIILRKAAVRVEKIDEKLEELGAILAVLIDIDKAISIIRKSADVDTARSGLMKTFKINENQADFILAMPLRKLTKADSLAVKNEQKELLAEKKELQQIGKSEEALIAQVDKELLETKKVISSPRRTVISGLTLDEMKEEEKEMAVAAKEVDKPMPCYVTRFASGTLLKSPTPFEYTASDKKYVNTPIIEQVQVNTQEEFVVVTNDGIGHRIPLSYLPMGIVAKNKDIGLKTTDVIVGISKNEAGKDDVGIAFGTKNGLVKIAKTDFPTTKNEFPVILLDEDDVVVDSRWLGSTTTNTFFTFVSASGNILVFDASTIRVSGSKSGGVKGMKLKDANDKVIAFGWVQGITNETFIVSQADATLKLTLLPEIPQKNKGGMGVALHGFKKGETKLKLAFVGENPILSITDVNNLVLLPGLSKRAARGVDFSLPIHAGASSVKIN